MGAWGRQCRHYFMLEPFKACQEVRHFVRLKRATGSLLIVFGLLLVVLVSGCASQVLRNSFEDYGDVYAEAQNHQMLLNLARLSQHHPIFFFQLGQINAGYSFSGNITGGGGMSDKSSVLASGTKVPLINWIFGPTSATAAGSSTPTFNYLPLNGGDFAAGLIKQLPPDTFHALFSEGFPVDVLMRTLVQQVRFTPANGTGEEKILYNVPTLKNETNYAEFLRLCDVLRQLQDRGYLYLEPKPVQKGDTVVGPEFVNPTERMVVDAIDKGFSWRTNENGKWQLERLETNNVSFQFQISPAGDNYLEGLKSPTMSSSRLAEITNLVLLLSSPGSLADKQSPKTNFVKASEAPTAQLRSYLFVLSGMANEQAAFDFLLKDSFFTNTNNVPLSQRRPVLRMDWSDATAPLETPLVKLQYQGKTYEITDPTASDGEYSSYNRDAFMLASLLITQISVDPTKINYQQQFLQVR
jgi:hypothetical protein